MSQNDVDVELVQKALSKHLTQVSSGELNPNPTNILDTLVVTILNAESMYVQLFMVLNNLEQQLADKPVFKSNVNSTDFTTVKDQYGKQD